MRSGFSTALLALVILVSALIIAGCGSDEDTEERDTGFTLRVNDIVQEGSIQTRMMNDQLLVDTQAFISRLSGVSFYPIHNPRCSGYALQYGTNLSFVCADNPAGFCSAEKVVMNPPVEVSEDIYWSPLYFIAKAIGAEIRTDTGKNIIDVSMPLPNEIGYLIAEAKAVYEELQNDFTIQQGEMCRTNPIELYATGYVEDCNGNNAGATYLLAQNPPSPRNGEYNVLPLVLQMDQDEAFVWIGFTPPETKYFSYQPYLMNRFFGDQDPPTIKKIYARLGDSINCYNIPLTDGPFETFFVLIITNNKTTYEKVEKSVIDAGIAPDQIMKLVIPGTLEPNSQVRFGLDLKSDSFNFLHRVSVFASDDKKNAYTTNPTIEILRVTPKTELSADPMDRPASVERQTGVREHDIAGIADLLEQLRAEIISAHAADYQYTRELKTSTWMYPGGDVAVEEREDVLGETNDTLYLKTEEFILNEDDLIVVYGPNHDRTGKSVYSNVSCYGALAENGVGGIVSTPASDNSPDRTSYYGCAEEYLTAIDPDRATMVYAYKFARSSLDDNTYAIPYNDDGSFNGHNNGDTVFMGYRIYVDRLTGVGPYPGDVRDGQYFDYMGPPDSEVLFDQAILFTNTPPF